MNNQRAQFRGKTPEPVLLVRYTEDGRGVVPVYSTFATQQSAYRTINVTGSVVLALPANPQRVGFIVKNQGVPNIVNDEVFWGLDSSLVAPSPSEGDKRGQLLCFGETFSSQDMPNYVGDIYVVCLSGESSQVSVVEWFNA